MWKVINMHEQWKEGRKGSYCSLFRNEYQKKKKKSLRSKLLRVGRGRSDEFNAISKDHGISRSLRYIQHGLRTHK